MPSLESQVNKCSKIWLPSGFQGMGDIGGKSLIVVVKRVGILGSTDGLGPGKGGVDLCIRC